MVCHKDGEFQYFKTKEKAMQYFEPKGNNKKSHKSRLKQKQNRNKNKNNDKNKDEDSFKNRKEYIGNVGLCKVSKVDIEKHKYVLSVTTSLHRTYLLKAINNEEYDKWYYCLSSQTKRLIFNRTSLTITTMTDEMENMLKNTKTTKNPNDTLDVDNLNILKRNC